MRIKNSPIVRFLKEKHYVDHIPYLTVGILSSIICIAYSQIFHYFEKIGSRFIANEPYWFLFAGPVLLVLSFLLVQKLAPGSSGSGIPQVMACIEKSHKHLGPFFLGVRIIFIKIASSCLAIFSGAAIGREGPSLHISAALAHNLARVFRRMDLPFKYDQMLVAGAASGLAAAFNTPIGGIVYAIEELSHEHVRSFKDVLLLSVVISGFTAQLILGNYLFLGYPQISPHLRFSSIGLICLLSFLCGILGSVFSIFLSRIIIWRFSKPFKQQMLIVAVVSFALIGSYILFGERSIFSGKETINFILFSKGELPFTEVLMRFASPLLSSMTGVAGGIFAPSLSAGAAIGGYVSQFFDPSLRTIMAMCGMIGFLTGVTHSPLTAFVLVLEMTDRHSAVLAMMFAAFFSSIGAHVLGNKSFYETIVEAIKSDKKLNNTYGQNES
ncbi:MAG: chloride channel protein [Bacteriovoracia bacterium]